jgi:exodeoxyribonuclease VII large subunit
MFDPAESALQRVVWGVSSLVHAIGDTLSARFAACTVRGELSSYTRAASGHCYFTLKDSNGDAASIRCAMFKRAAGAVQFQPADGQEVQLRGRIAVYEPRGELQFVVESMQRSGDGSLYEQFVKLKAKLEAEGLFDSARKRPVARYPRRVGVVTSLDAAALHDVVSVFGRRSPQVELVLYPSVVQGADAPGALIAAIEAAGQRLEVDTLLVVRGGGSIEDLWAFNDERVVRALAASPIPTISGVGHETDTTLADFAADLRAPTPTAAAELSTPQTRDDSAAGLQQAALRMRRRANQAVDTEAQRLDGLAMRSLRPAHSVMRQSQALALWRLRLSAGVRQLTATRGQALQSAAGHFQRAGAAVPQRSGQQLDRLEARLSGLDPARVLQRGFAWLSDADGQALVSTRQLRVGQSVGAVLADGEVTASITSIARTP